MYDRHGKLMSVSDLPAHWTDEHTHEIKSGCQPQAARAVCVDQLEQVLESDLKAMQRYEVKVMDDGNFHLIPVENGNYSMRTVVLNDDFQRLMRE